MRKHWKKIILIIILLILIILAVVSCSSGIDGSEDPSETTLPIETTQPVEETTVPAETTEPVDETTEPTEPEETVPPTTEAPTTEPPATEPLVTDPPATEAPKVQHTHSYTSKRKEPTCNTAGSVTYTCSACGYSYTEEISATGHKWSGWTVTTAATTEKEGSQSRTCGNCGYVQTQTIAKLPVVTERVETEPVSTQPPQTEPPKKEPAPTEPPTTEPLPTEPPVTEPPQTELPVTAPAGCNHSWETIFHQEEGHYEAHCTCVCGQVFYSTASWGSHVDTFSLEDAVLYHGGYSSTEDYIIDVYAYTEWVCSKCGASTTTQP